MAWVLKISAIELRVISSMGHMNKLEDLVKLFLYNNPNDFLKSRKGPNIRQMINGGWFSIYEAIVTKIWKTN